jgi:glycerol-3-phosphate acyltransferase PlsY
MAVRIVLLSLAGFLVGAIPFSWLIGRVKGIDLRKAGSGNIGATNLMRVCGRGPGIAGLFLDVAKGVIPVLLAALLAGGGERLVQAAAGTAAVLGHVYTPFLGFSGGKGVATSLGAMAALAPVPSLCALGIFLTVLLVSGIVSLSSIIAAASLVPAVFLFMGGQGNIPVQVACCLVALLVVVRHRSNIARLFRGEEKRLLGRKRG